MSEQPKPQTSYFISGDKVFIDEKGAYLNKVCTTKEWDNFERKWKIVETHIDKIRPEQLSPPHLKTKTRKIYIVKDIQSANSLSDERVVFEMELHYAFPEGDKRFQYHYFVEPKSGVIYIKELDSGCCSEAGVNSEFVSRGKAKKLPEDTLIPKNAPIFRINPQGELEREINSENVW